MPTLLRNLEAVAVLFHPKLLLSRRVKIKNFENFLMKRILINLQRKLKVSKQ